MSQPGYMSRLLKTVAADNKQADVGNELSFLQGTIVTWDAISFTNQVAVAGTTLRNLPVLTSAGLVALRAGDPVAILKYKATYFILGRIVNLSTQLTQPQFPIVLYPLFQSAVAIGTSGFSILNAGTLTSWEGRTLFNYPKVEIDGIWGQASGSNTTRYELQVVGQTIGFWDVTGTILVQRFGPFDVRNYIGQDWLKVELKTTISTGTGTYAFQPLAFYHRQS